MCEFCKQHSEGRIWYLQMENYSEALLHEPLSAEQRGASGTQTRYEWVSTFFREFTLRAAGGYPPDEEQPPRIARMSFGQGLAGRQLVHFGQVIPIEDVERIFGGADSITRMPCGCRYLSTGKSDCRYCFGLAVDRFNLVGEFLNGSSSLEVLSRDEAMAVLRAMDQEGLIHTVWTGVSPYVIGVCNCDRDCGAYHGYIEQRGMPHFFRAEYVCRVDWDACQGCKLCMQQCQFGSIFYSSALEKVYIDPARCFGCGLCRAACANDAITLMPRRSVPEAANLWLNEQPVG